MDGARDPLFRPIWAHNAEEEKAADAEALLRAERIAVQAGPRPKEDPEVLMTLRKALLGMKTLGFTYYGGKTPGASREVVPYGIIFSRNDLA